ncbi:hypothetical protein GCM10023318_16010 [Nocardia callitridis]|uniref:Uncharacterized protein n=1 Tax=Nocardia callitridis TaxID=648753 RepID=A0ABP9K3L5_9NOCA
MHKEVGGIGGGNQSGAHRVRAFDPADDHAHRVRARQHRTGALDQLRGDHHENAIDYAGGEEAFYS